MDVGVLTTEPVEVDPRCKGNVVLRRHLSPRRQATDDSTVTGLNSLLQVQALEEQEAGKVNVLIGPDELSVRRIVSI